MVSHCASSCARSSSGRLASNRLPAALGGAGLLCAVSKFRFIVWPDRLACAHRWIPSVTTLNSHVCTVTHGTPCSREGQCQQRLAHSAAKTIRTHHESSKHTSTPRQPASAD